MYRGLTLHLCHHGKQGLLGKLSDVCVSSITRSSVITLQASDVNSDIELVTAKSDRDLMTTTRRCKRLFNLWCIHARLFSW